MARRPLAALVDLLYPPRCAACDARRDPTEVALCAPCHGTLEPLGAACPRCAEPLPGPRSATCRRCLATPPPFAAVDAPWRYGGQLAVALRRLKFGGRADLARVLTPLYAGPLAAAAADVDLVVPVPLHWRRRVARGFDQAALLVARAALPEPRRVDRGLLRRVRATQPQTGRGADERRVAMAGAFAVPAARRAALAGRRVLLVDDVATTGATLAAAAAALLRAGAAEVRGFAVARAESPAR